ncbi:uncharacterized protein BJ212DRAFT_1295685 [Suillus subaureus]|uniref:Uncharacterized protein n=1 Tax=Suillus subaureus TaxID=48587 RepID=A0A9P7EKX3_9AGAM|nr:uncharacterized protein BJ212DRAFT_1295685 [Suillus subaureus]KAG1824539.1 hypothetical protein BJ212DRAFT_1295685 [Suillus subaureus]
MASGKCVLLPCTKDIKHSWLLMRLHTSVVLATAWEIEEAECFIMFLDAMHVNNKDQLKLMKDQLDSLRSLFSECDCTEVDDDRDYLQAVYEDEFEILKIVSSQAERVAKVLGLHVSKAFQSGVRGPRFPSSQPGVIDDEDNVNKALEHVWIILNTLASVLKHHAWLPHPRLLAFLLWPSTAYPNPGYSASSFNNYLNSFASASQANLGDLSSSNVGGCSNSLSGTRYSNLLSGVGYSSSLSGTRYSNPPSSAHYINSLSTASYSNSNNPSLNSYF